MVKDNAIALDEKVNLLCIVYGNNNKEIIFMSGRTKANGNIIHINIEYFNHQKLNLNSPKSKKNMKILCSWPTITVLLTLILLKM